MIFYFSVIKRKWAREKGREKIQFLRCCFTPKHLLGHGMEILQIQANVFYWEKVCRRRRHLTFGLGSVPPSRKEREKWRQNDWLASIDANHFESLPLHSEGSAGRRSCSLGVAELIGGWTDTVGRFLVELTIILAVGYQWAGNRIIDKSLLLPCCRHRSALRWCLGMKMNWIR